MGEADDEKYVIYEIYRKITCNGWTTHGLCAEMKKRGAAVSRSTMDGWKGAKKPVQAL